MSESIAYYTQPNGTNGAAVATTSFYNRLINGGADGNTGVMLAGNTLTFTITGIYLIRFKCAHFGSSGTRFLSKLFKNASATLNPSTPIQTDNIQNYTSIGSNIISITAGDTITIGSKVSGISGSFDGKAFSVNIERYLEVEIELLSAGKYASFYYSKAANTSGDNEATSYTGRTLTQQTNDIAGMILASATITFPPGNFRVRTVCTHFGASGRKFVHKFVTASTPVIGNGIGNVLSETISFLNVPDATTQDYQFKSKVNSTAGTPTMGKVGNLGEIEVYGFIDIVKL